MQFNAYKSILKAAEHPSNALEGTYFVKVLIKDPQKLIHFVDESPHGCTTVLEFSHHDLICA